MRLELSGSLVRLQPLTLVFESSSDLIPGDYIDLGYTDFDAICIGGGGGRGGGIDTANTGTLIRSYGGAGGGGGIQRVQGLLSELNPLVYAVVGAAGANGVDSSSDPATTTDGGDGGYSYFGSVDTCRASGGTGGKRVATNSTTVSTEADGGEGGIGGSITPGGGAYGGTAGTPDAFGGLPGISAADGTWDGAIGSGGGGGAGGVGKYGGGGTTLNAATRGGRGAYNSGDLSVYSPDGYPTDDPNSGSENVVPGLGGGAKGSPITGALDIYGRSGTPGLVVVRLTAV